MIIRLLILAAFAAFMVGCGSSGSAEASGDTKSLVDEIPKSNPDAPHFEAGGHSMAKGDTPDKQKAPGGAGVSGTGIPPKK